MGFPNIMFLNQKPSTPGTKRHSQSLRSLEEGVGNETPLSLFGHENSESSHKLQDIQTVNAFLYTPQGRQASVLELCNEGIVIASHAAACFLLFPIVSGSAPSASVQTITHLLLGGTTLALIYRVFGYEIIRKSVASHSSSDQAITGKILLRQARPFKASVSVVTASLLSISLSHFLNGLSPDKTLYRGTVFLLTYSAAIMESFSLKARSTERALTAEHDSTYARVEQLRSWLVLATDFLYGLFSMQNISYICDPHSNGGNREDFSKLSGAAFFAVIFASLSIILRCVGVLFNRRSFVF